MLPAMFFQWASAQIVSTTSNSSMTSKQIVSSQQDRDGGQKLWFMKLGANFSGLQVKDDYKSYDIERSLGYNLEIGMQKRIARTPLYYKFDFGACSNLGENRTIWKDETKNGIKEKIKDFEFGDQKHAAYISPINVGVKLNFGISFDFNIGAFYMLEYLPDDLIHDYGVNAEAGLWLSKFYLGVKAQRGLNNRTEIDDEDETFLSNILLRIGFSF